MPRRTYAITDLIGELVGPIRASGDHLVDMDRLENLDEHIQVVESMAIELARAAETADRHEDSMRQIGGRARGYLTNLRNHLNRVLDDDQSSLKELEAERDALAKFKSWVHDRLTANGVPEDPDPAKRELTGCRVGCRFEWLENRLAQAEAERNTLDQALADCVRAVEALWPGRWHLDNLPLTDIHEAMMTANDLLAQRRDTQERREDGSAG